MVALFTTGPGRWFLLAARLAIGAVFLYAAYSKLHFDGHWHLGDYQFIFAMGINSYQMYPFWFVNLASRVVPWLELGLGMLMILGLGLRWVSAAVTALLILFMVMLARSAILGLDINCGCFGYNSVKPSTELLHDSGLLVLSLLITAQAFLAHRAQRAVN